MNDDLKLLDEKVKDALGKTASEQDNASEKETEARQKNSGYRAGAELIINMVAGLFLGWLLDQWLGTMPLFLIIFFLTGFGWGLYKVYKITENLD